MSQFLDTVKGTVNTAVDSLSTVAQNFVEKNRTKAKLNRLRMVMKSESELMNRAYIALGKEYYEKLKREECVPTEKQSNLVNVVDGSKAKIARARDCYRKVLESQNEFIYAAPKEEESVKKEEVIDITVACSNEDDYSSSPFADVAEKIGDDVREATEEANEKAAEIKEKSSNAIREKAEEIKGKAEELKDNAAVIAHDTKDKAKEFVSDVKDKAVEIKDDFKEKATELKDEIKSKTKPSKTADEADSDELF